MSNRTLVELNHDYCPQGAAELEEWANLMQRYMFSGDIKFLPKGVTFKNMRHHSEPDPLAAAAPSLPSAEQEALDILWRDIDDLRDPKLSLVQVAAKAANALYWCRIELEKDRNKVAALSSNKVSKEENNNG